MNEPEKPDLTIGQRVRMRRDPSFAGPWPAEPLGTIVPWPTKDSELFVLVDHAWGQQRAYFVLFDEPQLDADGDGPYYKAEVWERYIEAIGDEELRSLEPAEPVVLEDGGDVIVFATIKKLIGYVEAIDVRDGIFEVWDATGRRILLAAASDRAPVTYAVGPDSDVEHLREILVRRARHPQIARTLPPAVHLDTVSLPDLLRILVPKERPPRRWFHK